jgi:hypothetical protein
LTKSGATPIEVGQPEDADWVVLADPEGNELCVVEPRPMYDYRGPMASILMESAEPARVCAFWERASGWRVVIREPTFIVLRAGSGNGPYLVIGEEEKPKRGKNRIHLDVAPMIGEDHEAAVEELLAAGARRVDIGQGEVNWVVLADPGGNELCVLTPR